MSSRPGKRKHLNGAKSRRRVIRIGERDNWVCQLCGGPVTPVAYKTKTGSSYIHRASVDHIVPIADGGSESDANLRLAHQSCNGYLAGDNNQPYQYFAIQSLAENESTDHQIA